MLKWEPNDRAKARDLLGDKWLKMADNYNCKMGRKETKEYRVITKMPGASKSSSESQSSSESSGNDEEEGEDESDIHNDGKEVDDEDDDGVEEYQEGNNKSSSSSSQSSDYQDVADAQQKS